MTAELAAPMTWDRARWAVTDTVTIARRNLLVWSRIPAYLVFTVVQPVVFVLLFRFVFGGAIDVPSEGGYVSFLVPGVVAQTAIFASFATAVALAQELDKGVIDRLRSIPMARSAVLTGRLLADTIRLFFTVIIVIAVANLVGGRLHNGLLPAIMLVVLATIFGTAIWWISAFSGVAIGDPEAVQSFGLIWLFPLTFFSSAFVPVETMPGWLQSFAAHQPVTYFVDTIRALALGGAVQPNLWKCLAWTVAIFVLFATLCARAYRRAT